MPEDATGDGMTENALSMLVGQLMFTGCFL